MPQVQIERAHVEPGGLDERVVARGSENDLSHDRLDHDAVGELIEEEPLDAHRATPQVDAEHAAVDGLRVGRAGGGQGKQRAGGAQDA